MSSPFSASFFDAAAFGRWASLPVDRMVDRVWLTRWLLGLRWAAVLGAGAVVGGAIRWGRVGPDAVWPLVGGVAGLALFNAVLSARGARGLVDDRGLSVQIGVDAALLAWLLHHAGGLSNPFAPFFLFHATTAGVLLPAPFARRVAVAIAALVALLTLAEVLGVAPPLPLLDATGTPLTFAPEAGHATRWVGGLSLAGTVLGVGLIVTTLVGALRREREQVASERESLQALIDCMADAVLFVTPDGVIRMRNKAATQLWPEGASPDADLRECHPPERWDALLALLRRTEPLTVHPVLEVRGRHFEASWSHVFDSAGTPRGVVMSARDITDRVEKQRLLMREERMATVGKLAAGLAHELNNPLGAIALFSQHALSSLAGTPENPLVDHLGTVLRNANLCKGIVRDLLAYARQRPPERTEVSVDELLGDVERTLQPHATSTGSRLVIERAPGTGPTLFGDQDQLRQVLVNLGLNALEALGDRGGTVRLRAAPEGGGTRLAVVDDGPGIAADAQALVFQAFHTSKPEGTGLGLTVAQDIVAAHGGRLTVESSPGAGCIFAFVVPPRGGLLSTARATAAPPESES